MSVMGRTDADLRRWERLPMLDRLGGIAVLHGHAPDL
jgi:hypothetical protein